MSGGGWGQACLLCTTLLQGHFYLPDWGGGGGGAGKLRGVEKKGRGREKKGGGGEKKRRGGHLGWHESHLIAPSLTANSQLSVANQGSLYCHIIHAH